MKGFIDFWRRQSTLTALILIMVAFEILCRSFADASFLSPRNLTNLSLQVAINGILAIGMTLIILTGGIDLSIGSVVAVTGIVLGLVDRMGFPPGIALAAAVSSGLAIGAISGTLIARFNIAPFVITLGMLVIARGAALILSSAQAIAPLSGSILFLGSGFLNAAVVVALFVAGFFAIGRGVAKEMSRSARGAAITALVVYAVLGGAVVYVLSVDRGLPFPVLLLTAVALVGALLSRHTVFGRTLYAVGGNEQAAILAGLNVRGAKLGAYVLMGGLAGLAGAVLAGRLNSATPTEGQLMELDAIASVVIGGTSLKGGVGTIMGSVIGAFIIGAMNNGMDLLEVSSNWQMVTKGLIIIFAVYTDARVRAGRAA